MLQKPVRVGGYFQMRKLSQSKIAEDYTDSKGRVRN